MVKSSSFSASAKEAKSVEVIDLLVTIPPKLKGKRGKMAKSDAHNLWE